MTFVSQHISNFMIGQQNLFGMKSRLYLLIADTQHSYVSIAQPPHTSYHLLVILNSWLGLRFDVAANRKWLKAFETWNLSYIYVRNIKLWKMMTINVVAGNDMWSGDMYITLICFRNERSVWFEVYNWSKLKQNLRIEILDSVFLNG